MSGVDIIECMGGTSRLITFLTAFIHFIHPIFCIANYCNWVRFQRELLGNDLVDGYLAMSIIAAVFYFLIVSVFYMWAWRFPDPEEVSKRRRIYGIVLNLLFCDIPIFIIGVTICWRVGFADALQGTSFVITCISFAYSSLRVWTFILIKLIKVRTPILATQPHFAGPVMYPNAGYQQRSHTTDPSKGYYGISASSNFGGTGDGMNNSGNGGGPGYNRNLYENKGCFQDSGDFHNGNVAPHNDYRRESQYNDIHYSSQSDQFSTPGHRDLRPRY